MRSNALEEGNLVDDNLITSFPNLNIGIQQNAIYWFIFSVIAQVRNQAKGKKVDRICVLKVREKLN